MKKLTFVFALVLIVSAFTAAMAGNINGSRSITQDMQITIDMPATSSTAPTWTSITSGQTTLGTVAANTNRVDMWVLNYSTNPVYAYTVGTSTQGVVDRGELIPGYSTSNTDWKVQLKYYTGAWYFVGTDIAGKNLRVKEYNK